MSAVALRCPQCGSTQDLPGECGTCHGADVRYYCANHAPGRWLDTPSCPDCGAHLNFDPSPPARPAARRPASPPPLRPATGPRPARPAPPEARPAPPPERAARPPRRPERPAGALPPWLDLPPGMPPRRRGGRTRAAPPDDAGPFPGGELPAAVRATATSVGGCLLRLAIVVVVMILLALGAGFLWVVRG